MTTVKTLFDAETVATGHSGASLDNCHDISKKFALLIFVIVVVAVVLFVFFSIKGGLDSMI